MADRTLVRLEKDGSRTTLADRYEGKRFSGPNDVVVKSNGSIYFTDSVNGLRGGGDSPQRELPYNGFYLVKDGKVTLLGGDRDRPGDFSNGIALSPDEKTLYVTAGFRKTMAYDVLPDDTVANPRVFMEAGKDGMKTDNQGNLYLVNPVGQGEVLIVDPNGKRLDRSNCRKSPGSRALASARQILPLETMTAKRCTSPLALICSACG
jgi:gluconolactonase